MNIKETLKRPLKDYIFYCLIGYAFSAVISITLSEFFILLGLGLWIADVIKNKISLKEQFRTPVSIPIVVFVLLHLISAIFGIAAMDSLRDFRKVYIILIFFLAANYSGREQDIKNIVKALIAGAVFVGLYAVINLVYHRVGLHDLNFRASSFSGHPNSVAGMLVLVSVVSASVLAHKVKNEIKDFRGIVLYVAAFLIIIAALLFTYARGAWIAAFVGLFMVLAYADKRLIIPVLIFLLAVVFVMRETSIVKRAVSSFNTQQTNTAVERMLIWKSGIQMIKDRPLIGIGTSNLGKIYPKYRLPEAVEPNMVYMHNNIIHIAVIDGIPGMLAMLWIFAAMWAYYIKGMLKIKKKYLKTIFYACLCVSAAFFVHGFSESNFIYTQYSMMFWFLMGMGYSIIKPGNNLPKRKLEK